MNLPSPGRMRTRATAVFRRPVPHHHWASVLGASGLEVAEGAAAVLVRFFGAPAGVAFAALAVAAAGTGLLSDGGSVAAGIWAADGAVGDEPGSLALPLLVTSGSTTGGPSGSLPLGFDSALGLLLGSFMVCVGRGSLSQEDRSAWSLP